MRRFSYNAKSDRMHPRLDSNYEKKRISHLLFVMPPRLYEIRTDRHTQQTPAPLLTTRRGQLPNLPAQIARQATPEGETLLLGLPLREWHVTNPNAGRLTKDVVSALDILPAGMPGAVGLTGQKEAVLFLIARGAGSRDALCAAAGRSSLAVRVDAHSTRGGVTPEAAAALHAALRTDFAIAPTDAPTLSAPPGTGSSVGMSGNAAARRRRAVRAGEQLRAFARAAMEAGCDASSLVASIQGGADATQRAACAATALDVGCLGGVSVDGLYAGEGPETRDGMICASLQAVVVAPGMRVLTGGTGAPWDVLRAVAHGVDVVDASFPFDMAQLGYATHLALADGPAPHLNVRDRKWETSAAPVAPYCSCFVCRGFSRAYLRHLFEVHEMMGVTLVAAHNLWDYINWFRLLRAAIGAGEFNVFVKRFEQARAARSANGALT